MTISKKKPPYPVSNRLRMYLDEYGRELDFQLKYEDLWGWSEAVTLEEIRAVARKYFAEAQPVVAIVRPAPKG